MVSHSEKKRREKERYLPNVNREEDPVGNWTLSVYDVDNPETTGYMFNWTLTLFGEMDPKFEGTPIHTTIGFHEDKEHEVPVISTTKEPVTKYVSNSSPCSTLIS